MMKQHTSSSSLSPCLPWASLADMRRVKRSVAAGVKSPMLEAISSFFAAIKELMSFASLRYAWSTCCNLPTSLSTMPLFVQRWNHFLIGSLYAQRGAARRRMISSETTARAFSKGISWSSPEATHGNGRPNPHLVMIPSVNCFTIKTRVTTSWCQRPYLRHMQIYGVNHDGIPFRPLFTFDHFIV